MLRVPCTLQPLNSYLIRVKKNPNDYAQHSFFLHQSQILFSFLLLLFFVYRNYLWFCCACLLVRFLLEFTMQCWIYSSQALFQLAETATQKPLLSFYIRMLNLACAVNWCSSLRPSVKQLAALSFVALAVGGPRRVSLKLITGRDPPDRQTPLWPLNSRMNQLLLYRRLLCMKKRQPRQALRRAEECVCRCVCGGVLFGWRVCLSEDDLAGWFVVVHRGSMGGGRLRIPDESS